MEGWCTLLGGADTPLTPWETVWVEPGTELGWGMAAGGGGCWVLDIIVWSRLNNCCCCSWGDGSSSGTAVENEVYPMLISLPSLSTLTYVWKVPPVLTLHPLQYAWPVLSDQTTPNTFQSWWSNCVPFSAAISGVSLSSDEQWSLGLWASHTRQWWPFSLAWGRAVASPSSAWSTGWQNDLESDFDSSGKKKRDNLIMSTSFAVILDIYSVTVGVLGLNTKT